MLVLLTNIGTLANKNIYNLEVLGLESPPSSCRRIAGASSTGMAQVIEDDTTMCKIKHTI